MDFFFLEPTHTFVLGETKQGFMLAMFAAVGFLYAYFLHRLQTGAEHTRAAVERLQNSDERLRTVLEKLKLSEKQFRTAFNEAPIGVALIDSQSGRILEVNPRFASIAGRTRDELATIDWMQITHPDDLQTDLDQMRRLNAGEIAGFEMKKRYIRPDGDIVWVSMTVTPVSESSGSVPRHLCLIDDITERMRSDTARLESEQRFHALYETMTEGVALHELVRDGSGRPVDYILTDVNPAFESILGLSRENVVGRAASAVYGQVPYLDLYADVATTGEPRHFEVDFVPLNKIFSVSAFSPGKNQFATVFDDITERRQAQEALLESNEKFRAIGESASDAIVMIDNDGNVVYWNAAAQSTFGYSAEEVLGRNLHEFITPDRFREAHHKGFEHFQKTGQGGAVGKTLELGRQTQGRH